MSINRNSPEIDRCALAETIRDVRRYEEVVDRKHTDGGYKVSRHKYEYIAKLSGLKHFLLQLKRLSDATGVRTVVDVGTGQGRAWSELSTTSLNPGLQFEATAVHFNQRLKAVWQGQDVKVHMTTAELMRGFAPESVLGVVAVYSLPYSVEQRTIARRFDQILVPGGIIKTAYSIHPGPIRGFDQKNYPLPNMNDLDIMLDELRAFGYDVKVMHPTYERGVASFLAIKPGSPVPISAQDLFKADLSEYVSQSFDLLTEYQQQHMPTVSVGK